MITDQTVFWEQSDMGLHFFPRVSVHIVRGNALQISSKLYGYNSMVFIIFTKGNNFCGFLFTCLDD